MHTPAVPPVLDDGLKPIYDQICHAIDNAESDKAVELVHTVRDRKSYLAVLTRIVFDLASKMSLRIPTGRSQSLINVRSMSQAIAEHDFMRAYAYARLLARALDWNLEFHSSSVIPEQEIIIHLAQVKTINTVVLQAIEPLSREQFHALWVKITQKAQTTDLEDIGDNDLHKPE